MAKAKKVRYDGVGVFANGYLLSRVQNVTVDTDLGEDEARELTNSEVVEYTSNNPQVSIQIETNEYGSCRNIRAIAQVTGGSAADNITVNSFDGTSVDIGIMTQEDGVLAKTGIANDAFLTSISWNYDVGGVATESFSFETDNFTWYANTYKQVYSVMGYSPAQVGAEGSVLINVSGLGGTDATSTYKAIKLYIDGVAVTGALTHSGFASDYSMVRFTDTNFSEVGSRYRVLIAATGGVLATTIPQRTSTSNLGSITRGKLDIYLVSGANDAFAAGTNMLRLQSISVDADMSREVLNELSHYRAYDRSLTLPVPVNVTFSAIASNLEEWAKFSIQSASITASSYAITDFTSAKQAKLRVSIYDKNDTITDGSRSLKKTLTLSGLQIVSQSFGVDVGGNATQDYGAKCSNFIVSGLGTPGKFPLLAAPTD